jgi:hypothetical protein
VDRQPGPGRQAGVSAWRAGGSFRRSAPAFQPGRGAAVHAPPRGHCHLTPCAFVGAEGRLANTGASLDALERAFLGGGEEFVRSYLRPPPPSPEGCWFWCDEWALSYKEVDGGRHSAA